MKRLSPEVERAIIRDYQDGLTIQEIQVRNGIASKAVYTVVDRNNIPRRLDVRERRCVNVDTTFFDELTPDSAWVLGLFLTDGSLDLRGTSKRMLIGFADRDLVDMVHAMLKTNAMISASKRRAFWSFRFTNPHIYDRLLALGVREPKFSRDKLPTIDPALMPHLIRGILDGDGGIGSSSFKNYGPYAKVHFAYPNAAFLLDLAEKLHELVGVPSKMHFSGGCWRLALRHTHGLTALRWLYPDSDGRRLERKYRQAKTFIPELP